MLYKKVIITGANGMLGHELNESLKVHYNVFPFGKKELDITDRKKIKKVFSVVNPDLIINCAAFTNVDGCENNPESAYEVNAEGAFLLAEESRIYNAAIAHISTDYVFDGCTPRPYTEEDICNPLNQYGKSKYKGEQLIASINDRHYIIRTAWLYGRWGNHFITKILDQAAVNREIDVVQDQIGNPTSVSELVKMICVIIADKHYGIFHAACSGEVSRYGLAKKVIEISQCSIAVRPIQSDYYNNVAKRPKYTALLKKRLSNIYGFQPVMWEEALYNFLRKNS